MNFGQALESLKRGAKVAREGWNGKGLYVQLHKGGDYEFSELLPFFVIKNVKNSFNTWVPSVSDCLAEDWELVDAGEDYDKRWNAAIENARFMLNEYKQIPAGAFGAMNIAQTIARYESGERSLELLEELEGIQ